MLSTAVLSREAPEELSSGLSRWSWPSNRCSRSRRPSRTCSRTPASGGGPSPGSRVQGPPRWPWLCWRGARQRGRGWRPSASRGWASKRPMSWVWRWSGSFWSTSPRRTSGRPRWPPLRRDGRRPGGAAPPWPWSPGVRGPPPPVPAAGSGCGRGAGRRERGIPTGRGLQHLGAVLAGPRRGMGSPPVTLHPRRGDGPPSRQPPAHRPALAA